MGKGERHKAESNIETYGEPAAQRSQRTSGQASNIMYGAPSSGFRGTTTDQGRTYTPPQPRQQATPVQQPRQQGMYPGDQSSSPNQYGYYNPPDDKGRLQGKDRVHEVARWAFRHNIPIEQALQKDLHGGDSNYLRQLLGSGEEGRRIAEKGWQPRPNHVPSYYVKSGGNWVDPRSISGGGGGGNYQQAFEQIFPGGNLTSDMLKAKEGELAQAGIKLIGPNAAGNYHKIELPDGTRVDVIGGVGSGDNSRQWHVSRPGSMMGPTGVGPMGGVAGGAIGDYGNIQGQLQNFATTGGYTPQDIANIRARAVSPIRSVYSSARRDLDRQRSLQGGYQPGRATALGRFAREQGQATADATTNVEAALAQMINQGRRFGLSGMAGMYGTTPGLASTFGSQALQAQALENAMARGMTADQIAASQLPGAWETSLGRIGQIGGAVLPFV